MDENEFKALVGEAAFNAMSADQRTAAIGRFAAPAPKPPKKGDPAPDPEDDESEDDEEDLLSKTRKTVSKGGDEKSKLKRMESAIGFNMRSSDFLKANAALLPPDASELFAQAEKENFDSPEEKAAELKSGLMQAFFQVQANADLLTAGQKAKLDEFTKLTKNGKRTQAEHVYEMIFEPAFERLKAERKARALNGADPSDVDSAYKERIGKKSLKHYGLEK